MDALSDPDGATLRIALALIPGLPLLAGLAIGAALALRRAPSERVIARTVELSFAASLTLTALVFGEWLMHGSAPLDVRLGTWFEVPGYGFHLSWMVDGLSLAMMLVTSMITLLVARFSATYLHREPGYARFFLLISLFVCGMQVLVMAGSYDLLFAGWELVGIASFLLIAFFHHRPGPVRGAIRAMVSYRIADVGLLVAGVLLHHYAGSAELADAFGAAAWPHATSQLSSAAATTVALTLLLAVMGKSAQFPFGGWLPRAMEGPTPSSALFYGALSVHAGVYLLLRSAPLLEISPIASTAVSTVGALTAVHATLVGRTQSDAKNALAYATMTQVGLMLVAIGLHLWTWTVVHMVGHACLRLYQQLRTPSALHDAEEIHAALGAAPRPVASFWPRLLPAALVDRVYFLALNRFFVDELIDGALIGPVIDLSRAADRFERAWVGALSGWIRSPRAHRRAAEVAARREPRAEGGGS
jgi:NADH-quinone oxidoreductase subunit L